MFHTFIGILAEMATPIDVSQKKYTRNTERFIRDVDEEWNDDG